MESPILQCASMLPRGSSAGCCRLLMLWRFQHSGISFRCMPAGPASLLKVSCLDSLLGQPEVFPVSGGSVPCPPAQVRWLLSYEFHLHGCTVLKCAPAPPGLLIEHVLCTEECPTHGDVRAPCQLQFYSSATLSSCASHLRRCAAAPPAHPAQCAS